MLFALLFVASIDCSFTGGFRKGAQDSEALTYGADPDRFCYGETQEKRIDYLDGYRLGQDHSKLFKKVGINSVPQNKEELESLLKEARQLNIQMGSLARPNPEPTSSAPSSSDPKSIEERLKALEQQNLKLKEDLEALKKSRDLSSNLSQ